LQDVSAYAGNLVNYIRANSPTATTDDIIGGAKIEALTPYTPPTSGPTLWGQAALCNVVLTGTCYPNYEKITPVALANLTALRTTLKLTLGTGTGSGFSPLTSQISFNSSDIYSHRLVVQFSASDVPSLLLDGVTQATGSGAVVAGNPLTIRTAIGHPNIPCSSLPSVATGTGSTTSGSTVISSVLLNCFPAAGWTITGSGIPANATVVSVNGSQITISAAATATGSANLTVTSPPTDTVHVTSGANAIFVVGTAWGGSDRGMIEKHRRLLQQNAAANPNPAAEPVLGEGLAMIGYTWLAEFTRVQQRVQEITGVTTSYLHAVGIIGMRTVTGGFQGPYVDLPLNTISLTQRSGHTSTSPTAPSPAEAAAFAADAGVSSVLESGSIEQTQPGATAVSTVKLLDLQSQSGAIFDINNTAIAGDNCSYYNGTIRPQLQTTYTATDLGRIDTLVGSSSNGAVCSAVPSTIRVIAPLNGALTINSSPPGSGSWTGTGYQQLLYTTAAQTSLGGVGNIITGGLSGGMPASNVPPPEIKSNQTGALSGSQYVFPSQGAGFNSSPVNTNIAANLGGSSNTQKTGGDPIDLVAGNYVYNHQDLSVGSGAFPDTLAFARTFDSGLAQTGRNTSLLGNGWMHSYDMTGLPDSDGFEGMGDNSPISGAAAIATLYVVQDLFQGAVGTTQLIVAAQAETWLMGQLTNNVATVTRPGSSERFTLLPSGAYNAPIGSPAVLTGTSAAGYLYHGGDGVSLTFNPTTAVASGRVTNWSSAAGASMAFSYNALGQLQAVCEPNCSSSRRRLNFTYAGNSLTSVNDGSGSTPRTVSFAYDANNNLSAVTDPLGYRTTFNYAGVGQLLQLSYPAAPGAPFLTNAYNSLGRPNQQADANGSVTTIHIAGSRAETIDPIGTSRVSYFSPRGRTLATIDGLGSADINGGAGNLTSYAYDGLDRVMEVTYPAGRSQSYTYDANSNPLSITSAPPSGSPLLTQNFTYVSPVSALPNFEQVSTATDPKGIVTSYGYDFFGNRISVIADSGSSPHINAKTTFTFDSVGRMLSSTDPLGAVTRMTYDGLGNLISSVKDSGRLNVTTGLSYDAVGNVLNLTDPNGNVTTSAWDADRRLSNTVSPAGSGGPLATTYSYDPNANLLQTQQSSNGNVLRTTSATYTLTGKVATSTDARGNVTRYAYDADDRLSQTTDPIGNVSVLGYDSLGRQASLSHAAIQANPLWQKTYSPDGLLASFSDAAPNTTSFAYDGFDRLSTTTWPNASTEVLTYDANGNALTRKTRVNATITYTYDTLNRLATKTPPSPAPVVSYAYDLNNHLTGVSDNSAAIVKPSSSASYSVAYAYDAMNRPVSATWPNVPAQTALTASSVSSSFTYDATNRRIGQTVSDDSWWSRPTAASPISYTANNLNQYTAVGSAHPTYDGNGNLTSDGHFTYCYDTESRRVLRLRCSREAQVEDGRRDDHEHRDRHRQS